MSSLFVLVLTQKLGDMLIFVAFSLARPAQYQQPDDITKQVGQILKHPIRDEYCWQFTDDLIFIHPKVSQTALDQVLYPLLYAGKITQEDIDRVHADILAKRGTFANVLDIFPPALMDGVKSFEQMKEEGWFPDPPEEVLS